MAVTFTKGADVDPGVEPDAGEEFEEGDSPAPAGLLAQLRPYLPTRYIGEALCSGSLALSRRGLEWATAGGWKVTRGRLGGLVVAGYVAYYEDTHGHPWVLPVACCAWLAGALALSPTKRPADQADDQAADVEDQEDGADTEFEGEPPQDSPAPLPRRAVDLDLVVCLAHELASADDSANSRAVQLDHLLTHLAGVSKDALIAALAEAGVRVNQVKYRLPGGRQQVRQGVRLEDLPAVPGEAPATPAPGLHAVAAGPAERAAAPSPTPASDPSLRAG